MNRKKNAVGWLFSLGLLVAVAGLAIAEAMGWLPHVQDWALHWTGHVLRLADRWLQSVVNWFTIPFKWMFIFIVGLVAGSWISLSGWLNPILGIPDPANLLNRLEQEAERRRRRRRGLSRADIEELRRRLESLAGEYGLNLAQIREITRWVWVGDNLEPDDTRISSDL